MLLSLLEILETIEFTPTDNTAANKQATLDERFIVEDAIHTLLE